MRLAELCAMCNNQCDLVKFLRDRNVLISEMKCPKCDDDMSFSEGSNEFRCQRRTLTHDAHKRKVSVRCNTHISMYHNSWFAHIHIPLPTAMMFIGYYLMLHPPRQTFLEFELGLSPHTVVDRSNFVREILIDWCEDHSQMIGGPGIVVEIDETKIGHRKYSRGRIIEGHWVFGAIERDSKSLCIKVVKDRSMSTLLHIIEEWIRPGTTIISDKWKSYQCLDKVGFTHLTVNHSINFVNPETGAHTQHIERSWRDLKHSLSRYGTIEEHYHGYLCEFLFKRAIDYPDRI